MSSHPQQQQQQQQQTQTGGSKDGGGKEEKKVTDEIVIDTAQHKQAAVAMGGGWAAAPMGVTVFAVSSGNGGDLDSWTPPQVPAVPTAFRGGNVAGGVAGSIAGSIAGNGNAVPSQQQAPLPPPQRPGSRRYNDTYGSVEDSVAPPVPMGPAGNWRPYDADGNAEAAASDEDDDESALHAFHKSAQRMAIVDNYCRSRQQIVDDKRELYEQLDVDSIEDLDTDVLRSILLSGTRKMDSEIYEDAVFGLLQVIDATLERYSRAQAQLQPQQPQQPQPPVQVQAPLPPQPAPVQAPVQTQRAPPKNNQPQQGPPPKRHISQGQSSQTYPPPQQQQQQQQQQQRPQRRQ